MCVFISEVAYLKLVFIIIIYHHHSGPMVDHCLFIIIPVCLMLEDRGLKEESGSSVSMVRISSTDCLLLYV